MKRALLVAGGSMDLAFGAAYMKGAHFDLLVAIDGGLRFFYDSGIVPDWIVGDFDSAEETALRFFEAKEDISWMRLIPEKDDTDTEAALRRAIDCGCEEIHILGATGSRLDHVFGNIALLGIGLLAGVEILLADPKNRIRMIDHSLRLTKREQYGSYVSLLPFTSSVTGVTLKGMKYPLTDVVMTCCSSLGISNEIVEEEAEISCKEGRLLVFETKD